MTINKNNFLLLIAREYKRNKKKRIDKEREERER